MDIEPVFPKISHLQPFRFVAVAPAPTLLSDKNARWMA
jgi:hypothetical protein